MAGRARSHRPLGPAERRVGHGRVPRGRGGLLLHRPGALAQRRYGHLSERAFDLERRGFEYVPESERTMTLRETALFWVGTNANLFFVSVGVIALSSGLSVRQALGSVVAGTLLLAVVALGSIAGVRSGLPTLTFTRAVFGPRGNLPHAVLAW